MNGDRKNSKLTVRLNGERWTNQSAEKSRSAQQPLRWNTVADQAPVRKQQREGDAWTRLAQLRDKAQLETSETRETSSEYVSQADQTRENSHTPRWRPRIVIPDWVHRQGWAKTLLTTGGAVAIGLLFGFMVLSVFHQEQLHQSYQTVLSDTVATLTAQGGAKTTPEAEGGEAQPVPASVQASATKLNIPGQDLFVAQAGAFQLEVPREAAVAALKDAGLPHLLYKQGDKQYLFAAGAPDRNAVLGFASSLKQKGIDVYVKEMKMPPLTSEVTVAGGGAKDKAPDLNSFLQNGWKIAKALSLESGNVVSLTPSSLSKEEEAQLKEQHRRFLEESRLLETPEKWQPMFAGMINGINQGMAAHEKMGEAIAGKKQNSAESYAWQVQAGVLQFWESYVDWAAAVEKEE